MSRFELPSGLSFVIDDADAHCLDGRNWFSRSAKDRDLQYVMGRKPGERGENDVLLHRLILNLTDGQRCVFKNLNGLDCRRENMIAASQSEVAMHMRKKRHYKKYKGVFWDARRKTYYAQIAITADGKRTRHSRGPFDAAEQAAAAYDELAALHHGQFAHLNFAPTVAVADPPTAPTSTAEG